MAKNMLVFSGKGGVGKSSVTACLSRALSALGKKVLVMDADIGFRSLDLIMGVGTGIVFNWLDVIENNCKPENAFVPCGQGSPDLLTAPAEYSQSITSENIGRLFELFGDSYDYILVDSPAGAGNFHDILAKKCDSALLVATPDAVSVRCATTAADKVLSVNEKADIRLIINRFNKEEVLSGIQMKVDDVIDSTAVQLIGIVPEDDSIRFLPEKDDVVRYPKEAFLRIARRMNGENVPLREKDFY